MRLLVPVILISAALAAAGCGGDDDSSADSTQSAPATSTEATTTPDEAATSEGEAAAAEGTKPKVEVPSGAPPKKLVVEDLEPGTGPAAKAGDEVTVQYVGVNYEGGDQFDASWDRGEPFSFTLGAGEVIPGWDQGVEGMKAGGRRQLVIPPNLAYGSTGSPPIGPNETLVFVIDLLSVN